MGYGRKNNPIIQIDDPQFKAELNGKIERVNADLASMPTKADLERIGSATPEGFHESLSDLESAHPTGSDGVHVVTADGNWYYWNGAEWTVGGIFMGNSSNPFENALTTENEPWEVV